MHVKCQAEQCMHVECQAEQCMHVECLAKQCTCALSLVSDRGPEVGNAVEIESDDREVVSDHDAAVVVSDARVDHVNESVRSVVLSALVNAAPTETKVKNRSYVK